MLCYKCSHYWQDTPKTKNILCPNCGTNLLKSLTLDSTKIGPEYKLQYIIHFYEYDILQYRQIIYSIVKKHFSNNIRLRNLIFMSIRLDIPEKIKSIKYRTTECMTYDTIREYLKNKTSMSDMEADEIIYDWQFAIPEKKIKDNSVDILEMVRRL
jgi:hypothetical protein